jgi:hypothetical protein
MDTVRADRVMAAGMFAVGVKELLVTRRAWRNADIVSLERLSDGFSEVHRCPRFYSSDCQFFAVERVTTKSEVDVDSIRANLAGRARTFEFSLLIVRNDTKWFIPPTKTAAMRGSLSLDASSDRFRV